MKRVLRRTFSSSFHSTFREQGYVVIPNVLSKSEIEALQNWTSGLSSDLSMLHHHELTADGDIRLTRSERIIDSHDGFKSLLYEGPVKKMMDDVVGESMILYKEKVNYKYPSAGGYVAHQDAPAYQEVDYHVTALVSIDDAPEESGCLEFAAGWRANDKQFYGLNDRGVINDEEVSKLNFVPAPTKAGDVVIFSSYIPHRSARNSTENPRRVLYATFNEEGKGDFRKEYYTNKLKKMEGEKISLIDHFSGEVVESMRSPKKGADPQDVWKYISWIFASRGSTMYDETVTQIGHALQGATLAVNAKASSETVVATLLHDFGHLILDEHQAQPGFLTTDLRHEEIGANWLMKFFAPEISNAVRLHVPAKRYLCYERPEYWAGLSDMSKRSLELQGGIFSKHEAEQFLSQVGAKEAVQVRLFDDRAKSAIAHTLDIQDFKPIILQCLKKAKGPDADSKRSDMS